MRRTRSAYIIRRRAGLWQEPEGGIYLKKDKAAAKQAAREQKEAERLRQARLQQKQDEKYMRQAITQAKKAEKIGEVPIGCVIVYDGKVIGRGYNRRKIDKNTLSHAELTAIRTKSIS